MKELKLVLDDMRFERIEELLIGLFNVRKQKREALGLDFDYKDDELYYSLLFMIEKEIEHEYCELDRIEKLKVMCGSECL